LNFDWSGTILSQTIRLLKSENYIDIANYIEIVQENTNIVLRIETGLNNNSTFYSDDGGRDFQKRIYQDQRGGIEANYYPCVRSSYLEDKEKQLELAVFTKQTHGCSNPEEGALEFMLFRRIMNTGIPDLGLNETLNDTAPLFDVLRVMIDYKSDLQSKFDINSFESDLENSSDVRFIHKLSLEHNHPVLFASQILNSTFDDKKWINSYNLQYSALNTEIPLNSHLLSWKIANTNQQEQNVLFRIEHTYEIDEDPILSNPFSIDLAELFVSPFSISKFTEMTLTFANEWSNITHWKWNYNENEEYNSKSIQSKSIEQQSKSTIINLLPKQLRTFKIFN